MHALCNAPHVRTPRAFWFVRAAQAPTLGDMFACELQAHARRPECFHHAAVSMLASTCIPECCTFSPIDATLSHVSNVAFDRFGPLRSV